MRVAAIGAACGGGIGIAPISAALRGGVNVFAREPSFPCRTDGAPMLLAASEPLDIRLPWQDRLIWLVRQALEPVNRAAKSLNATRGWTPSLALMLSLPPPRPGIPPDASRVLARQIAAAVSLPVDRDRSMTVRSSHDGALCCLGLARDMLAGEVLSAVLVGGIDSWIDIEALHWLERQRRLKRPEAPNGIVPGEGAAFLLLVSDTLAKASGLTPNVLVRAQARSFEPNPWYEHRPCLAEGLTTAMRTACAGLEPAHADLALGDLNGESWRAEEWMLAYVRTQRFHTEPLNLWHPADFWGDTGAAAGALLSALAAHELMRDQRLGHVLVWCCSDVTPYRSAALLAADGRRDWS